MLERWQPFQQFFGRQANASLPAMHQARPTTGSPESIATNSSRVWPLPPGIFRLRCLALTKSEYLTEHDGIIKTVQMYIYGSPQGKSELMRPAFHPDVSFFGYAGQQLAITRSSHGSGYEADCEWTPLHH